VSRGDELRFRQRPQRNQMTRMLHELLADQFAVSVRMRNCRWNVTGSQELRRLFASHDELVGEMMDEIGERALATGNKEASALAAFLKLARAKAHPGEFPRASEITSELLVGHEAVVSRLRENLERCTETGGEMISGDFLNGIIEKHENMAAELHAVAAEPNQRRANGLARPLEGQPMPCASF
jgi:DNA-binding ferritin-like protein (oxidative damage protectant)